MKSAQLQSQATVIAVETRSHQMELWLSMMGAMADASGQVQLATQKQRSAVENAVFATEHIAESSRSVAETAQAIAVQRHDKESSPPTSQGRPMSASRSARGGM